MKLHCSQLRSLCALIILAHEYRFASIIDAWLPKKFSFKRRPTYGHTISLPGKTSFSSEKIRGEMENPTFSSGATDHLLVCQNIEELPPEYRRSYDDPSSRQIDARRQRRGGRQYIDCSWNRRRSRIWIKMTRRKGGPSYSIRTTLESIFDDVPFVESESRVVESDAKRYGFLENFVETGRRLLQLLEDVLH